MPPSHHPSTARVLIADAFSLLLELHAPSLLIALRFFRALAVRCELFTAWGWKSGDPSLEFKVVECPAAFERIIGSAFGRSGVQPASSEVEADVQLPPPYQPLQSTIDNKEKVLKLTGSQVLLRLEPSLISLND